LTPNPFLSKTKNKIKHPPPPKEKTNKQKNNKCNFIEPLQLDLMFCDLRENVLQKTVVVLIQISTITKHTT